MGLKHAEVWQAIDQLAARNGLSVSGLAKRAGLDPTTFNKSKRLARDGRPRWPSTESVAKILEATGTSMANFLEIMQGAARRVPLIGYAQAGARGYFDDAGYPSGAGWDEVDLPQVDDPHAYALQVTGDSMEPVYRAGDVLVVSPEGQLRPGDRVVARTREGEVMAKILRRQSPREVILASFNSDYDDRRFTPDELDWIARIVWASQ